MPARLFAAIALIVVGGALDVPIASLLGAVTLMLDGVHIAWARRGLGGVRYSRALAARRTPFGGEIPLRIEVWNRSRLPLAWLRADDETSAGVVVREREVIEDGDEDEDEDEETRAASCATRGRSGRSSVSSGPST